MQAKRHVVTELYAAACKAVSWRHVGFAQLHLILGGSGNSDTPSNTYRRTQAGVVGLSPVTTGLQTQGDLLAYSNPSGSELPKQAAAVSQAERRPRHWERKRDR